MFAVVFSMFDDFVFCAEEAHLPHRDLCPDDHIWTSLHKYSGHISEQLAGFHPQRCKGRLVNFFYGKCPKVSYTFLQYFLAEILLFMQLLFKMLSGAANNEDPDQTAPSV